jgi:hypothetical protein
MVNDTKVVTYIGRPRQRVFAIALNDAFGAVDLTGEQEDDILFAVYDSLSKNNGRPASGFKNFFKLEV